MSITLLNFEKGIWVKSVESTNTLLKKSEFEPGVWIFADEQTHGRGRRENIWNSIGDDKIIFSGKIEFMNAKFSISLLSLLIGSAVLKSIIKIFPEKENELKIKWPNDIYRNSKKIAGILIECEQQGDRLIVIVGIGVNIFGEVSEIDSDKIGFLSDTMPSRQQKRKLIENLIDSINFASIAVLEPRSIRKEIAFAYSKSFLSNKKIKARIDQKNITGRTTGFTLDGFLVIESETGERFELMDSDPSIEVIQ